ncbi:16S rRNA (adenine(1518)-N(6)/adenine(1519)-N(6))-dimethyltransferase [Tessaracoccus lapidicaptus]|uniref:Ribosomal RNA small subunit methyltransferase A n=1 Tax=Tessaracoccus lapidicaptus TaxID=1427523 RepID=A0A1C0APT2_9ACTN|nr:MULTISPECIES: 16S rRNA (adenine(1518)-N(6)/adenine(1519)-N(6))-dimethyltransferase RsmA [Tessaracoccus]AQX15341.1 16S rRNA (adenine(1518)-N(6)/adenine(1519)-N(6))-dimethyltransferase [Tessaracoccus sp. T2.5-30]OCL36336.1 16S rRNA (adenine(1518)-N(6)/adenine(1519)-N(6))-dimethyltransferase [Tessaracoccus lapidicaptus]VEP39626.1 Ribosomal RNA small subunit methyltransferase A [Tessaracoccus lapidicaptus]
MPETGLLDPASVRRIAAELDLRPTKQRGQNFVVDPNTVRRIVALSGIGVDDVVLEIGPGLGSLTLGLLETGARVVAVEIEDRLAHRLERTVRERMGDDAAGRLAVVNADALEVSQLPGPPPSALVANLPYNVSVPVLLRMMELFPEWRTGLVMVQLEVADRLVAAPGSKVYGVPSAKVAWYAEATRVGTVPPKVFWPVPNVDSGLVRLVRRPAPDTTATREDTFRVIDAAFAQRRKMLRAALGSLAGSAAEASAAIAEAGIDPQLRGEMLGVDSFAAIAERLGPRVP